MINNIFNCRRTLISNNYQETGTVINYYFRRTANRQYFIGILTKREGSCGLRYFSNVSTQPETNKSTNVLNNRAPNNTHMEALAPITLPQHTIFSGVFGIVINALLFALLMREKFLLSICIILALLFLLSIYYIFFENKTRIFLFLKKFREAILTQPRTLRGILRSVKLLLLA
jgi:hypothetical protein